MRLVVRSNWHLSMRDKTIPPSDLRETLIHSIQKQVEIDEPETLSAPARLDERPKLGRDAQTDDTVVDTMTEEELLQGLSKLSPEDPSGKTY